MYIHDHHHWPDFYWRDNEVMPLLTNTRHQQGLMLGKMKALGFELQPEAILTALTEEVVKTSDIEGETLNRDDVRSSLARRLGVDAGGLKSEDRSVEGIVEIMLDATQNHDAPLTRERLFSWHAALFPAGQSGLRKISVGKWRTDIEGPMQVVSGAFGRENVHFEAPAAERLEREMQRFLAWFNSPPDIDPVLFAGVAHFWFVTLHPFDDGNGRLARAIGDMALARSEGSDQRFYSLSSQIREKRAAYYATLELTQKGSLDITEWLVWFLETLTDALLNADTLLASTKRKARIWDRLRHEPLNDRQRKVINRLLDRFEGRLNTSKWAAITKTSKDTALRDITDLKDRGILKTGPGGGRSVHYILFDDS